MMEDPFPPPSARLAGKIKPIASYLGLHSLPLHIHEVIFAVFFYQAINLYVSPFISARLFPKHYPKFNERTRLNWDVHVVSLIQSIWVNFLALWVIFGDKDRANMGWEERVYGYSGAAGLMQGFATGYFIWDTVLCAQHLDVFGFGMLAHAVSAVVVYMLGFRPFINYYGPLFILFELSTPLLNFHWFFDKLQMTGSRAQLYNGVALLVTFFGCRLVWGPYQSLRLCHDIWIAMQNRGVGGSDVVDAGYGLMRFAGTRKIPYWVVFAYITSNLCLNGLNYYWFTKMVDAVRKRFTPQKEGKKEPQSLPAEQLIVEGVELSDLVELVPAQRDTTKAELDDGAKHVTVNSETEMKKRN